MPFPTLPLRADTVEPAPVRARRVGPTSSGGALLAGLVMTVLAVLGATTTAMAAGASTAERLSRLDATPGTLPKTVLPLKVTVHLEVDPDRDSFGGEARYELQVRKPVRSITMHARDLRISEVRLRGVRAVPSQSADAKAETVTFQWPRPIPAGRHELSLRFGAELTERGEGLYRARDTRLKDRSLIATEMEPTGARRMLPAFDEPSFRSVWELAVTTDARHTVVSNMPAVRRIDAGAGRMRTQFAATPPMPSYLLALAVGRFDRLDDTHRGTALGILVPPGEAARAEQAMRWTKPLLDHFEDYFQQPYGLPKLDQIGIPGKRGGMENWGLITYFEQALLIDPASTSADRDYFSHSLIAHEIAHQWFGNLVTMAWWNDVWLNEAFATWMAFKATRVLHPQWELSQRWIGQRERAMATDVLATAAPVVRPVPRDSLALATFDAISYEKGAAVLHMIERMLGEATFREGLRLYMREHRLGNTVADDLWQALSKVSGRKDLRGFARAWTTQPGFPLVDVSQRCEAGRAVVRVAQRRFLLREGYAPEQRWPLSVVLKAGDHSQQALDFATEATELAAGSCGDRLLVDPGAHGYFRVRYDEPVWQRLVEGFSKLDAIDQQRLMADTWALAGAGLVDSQRVLQLLDGLPDDAPAPVWRMAVGVAGELLALVHDGPERPAAAARLRGRFAPTFTRIGWEPAPGEGSTERALRGDLVHLMGRLDDPEVVAEARRRWAARERAPQALLGDVGSAVIRVVGRHASVDDWNGLQAALNDRLLGPAQGYALSRALGMARDPAVAAHALGVVLEGKLPRAFGDRLPGWLAREAGHGREVWRFVQAHQARLMERGDHWTRQQLYPSALEGSRDLELAKDVQQAADKALPEDLRGEVRQALAEVQRRAWAYEAVSRGLAPR